MYDCIVLYNTNKDITHNLLEYVQRMEYREHNIESGIYRIHNKANRKHLRAFYIADS